MNDSKPNFLNRPQFRKDPNDTTTAPILLGVGGALLFTSLGLLAARLWSRVQPVSRLHWDDWTVIASTFLAIVNYILLFGAVIYGLGRHAVFVAFARRRIALELLFIAQVIWYWGITLVKLSVACLLLRVKRQSRPWKIFLYSLMAFLILAACVQTVFQFTQCRPFSVYWDPRVFRQGPVKCFAKSTINANIVTFSSIQVTIDLMFSFIPITFIRKLNRPRREKVFLSVMMGLGLFASAGAIIRTIQLQYFYTSRDLFRTNVGIALWAIVELQFALIAATIPTLKAFLEKVLIQLGLFFYDANTETEVRSRLIAFGLLDADAESSNPKPTVTVRTPKKVRDEYGDTIVDTVGDKEVERELAKFMI
ncbi:uncharacterized protein BDR25DRAFT_374150 [Lindgomyces ingoldianus]|uniref:Uncharacterized protein n=1 Tax=Lindgomyces ingoldianus TaxID=673940 RepID=A0ACB6QNL3_9PLEO|nr:uncharacterized protein BDR25DRAFT_374150 [Lindgomyces ingoldianus]KAF2467877.1 hypothetical protein BDR25DRAFT_374150 [Lindgomyces ingoldianus]